MSEVLRSLQKWSMEHPNHTVVTIHLDLKGIIVIPYTLSPLFIDNHEERPLKFEFEFAIRKFDLSKLAISLLCFI